MLKESEDGKEHSSNCSGCAFSGSAVVRHLALYRIRHWASEKEWAREGAGWVVTIGGAQLAKRQGSQEGAVSAGLQNVGEMEQLPETEGREWPLSRQPDNTV